MGERLEYDTINPLLGAERVDNLSDLTIGINVLKR